jgi:hypothetical protein
VLRRYALPSLVILIVSLVTAAIAYKAGHELTYQAGCLDEVFVRAPSTQQGSATPDFLRFTNSLAATQIALATPEVHREVTKSQHLTFGTYAANVHILPAPGIATFQASYTDKDPAVAKRVANATCTAFVSVMKKQRADEINQNISVIEGRLKTTQAELQKLTRIAPKKRTPAQRLTIATDGEVLKANSILVASLKSLPPDNITVLTPAANATPKPTTSLKKYLLIALLAALLAIFLYILVGEAISPPGGTRTPRAS